jgi:hypothetical protein
MKNKTKKTDANPKLTPEDRKIIDKDNVLYAAVPPAVLAVAGPTNIGGSDKTGAPEGSSEISHADSAPSPIPSPGEEIPPGTDAAIRAVEALASGDWNVSWSFGTVSVDMSPDNCRLVSTAASIVAGYGGKKFIDSLFSGKPWFMLVIWGLIVADAGYVSYVLSSCANNNHRGRLHWSIFTGVFLATELPGDVSVPGTSAQDEDLPAPHL